MNLIVTPAAAFCFLNEWGYQAGDCIRLYVRYAGEGGNEPFRLGIAKDVPYEAGISAQTGKMTFYMESSDMWFLDGKTLTVDCRGEDIEFRLA
ncbi:HesB/YadR/YfhF family protein [Paenibacillus sp. y28]|uniref:HesB/YadR/YfhF family protein n=1 Tax=Paenibacillus sp. y28 TaxID=3129110 RepID=UPI003019AAC0